MNPVRKSTKYKISNVKFNEQLDSSSSDELSKNFLNRDE